MAKKPKTLDDVGAPADDDKKKDSDYNSVLANTCSAFTDVLASDYGLRLLQSENVLYMYSDGAWSIVEPKHYEEFEPVFMAQAYWNKVEWGTHKSALWTVLNTRLMRPGTRFDDIPLIAMPHGTLDPRDDPIEVVKHDPKHYITRRIAVQYEEGAECPEWEAMLLRMLEHPDRSPEDAARMAKFLQQWVGVNIVGPKAKANRQLQKGLIIEGVSGTGKTTFADVVSELFGGTASGRVVAMPMSELGGEYGKAPLINAQALITDDGIESTKVVDPRVLKAIVTGEQMTVNRKFKDHISFRFNGAVLFTTNVLPNFRDESDAVYNRFVLVRMDRVFTPADVKKHLKGMKVIPYLRKKKEFPGILNWALRGFAEAYDNQGFDLPPEVKDASDVFRMRNDPIFGFLKECVAPGKKAVSAPIMTAMCQEYAGAAYNMTKISPRTIHGSMQKVIREVWKDVSVDHEGSVRNVIGYDNVELTPLGMAYWQKARDKNVAGLEGLTSPYGKRV